MPMKAAWMPIFDVQAEIVRAAGEAQRVLASQRQLCRGIAQGRRELAWCAPLGRSMAN